MNYSKHPSFRQRENLIENSFIKIVCNTLFINEKGEIPALFFRGKKQYLQLTVI